MNSIFRIAHLECIAQKRMIKTDGAREQKGAKGNESVDDWERERERVEYWNMSSPEKQLNEIVLAKLIAIQIRMHQI